MERTTKALYDQGDSATLQDLMHDTFDFLAGLSPVSKWEKLRFGSSCLLCPCSSTPRMYCISTKLKAIALVILNERVRTLSLRMNH